MGEACRAEKEVLAVGRRVACGLARRTLRAKEAIMRKVMVEEWETRACKKCFVLWTTAISKLPRPDPMASMVGPVMHNLQPQVQNMKKKSPTSCCYRALK